MKTGTLILLAIPAFSDLRTHRFHVLPVLTGAVLLLVCRFMLFEQVFHFWSFMAGLLPGSFFLLLNRLSRGGVGAGDAMLIALLGLVTGFWNATAISMLAVTLTGVTGLVLIVTGKADRKAELPFVPFLLTAYVLLLAVDLLPL